MPPNARASELAEWVIILLDRLDASDADALAAIEEARQAYLRRRIYGGRPGKVEVQMRSAKLRRMIDSRSRG